MAKRTTGRRKLTPEVQRRLAEMAAEAQRLIYGEMQCPEWGTSFAEIEQDAKEIGCEFIRVLMQQVASAQSSAMPAGELAVAAEETARPRGTRERRIQTEAGVVVWNEPQAYLPKSRKAFFPSEQGPGAAGG